MVEDQSMLRIPDVDDIAPSTPGEAAFDRVDELLSYFFDDDLTAEAADELNRLLASDSSARTRCFEMARLHADLIAYYRVERGVTPEEQVAESLRLVTEVVDEMAERDSAKS
ncbi:MAG: hypothetical protein ACRCT8_10480 [Lacipirellulaceae bacterium]